MSATPRPPDSTAFSSSTSLPSRLCLALVLTAGLAFSSLAVAQQYRDLGGGRSLDRNLQVGSGGFNPRGRDVRDQIILNNAIMTGNAPGGRSFRGSVPYRAAGEFTGTLGSDTLFNFRRDSLFSAAPAAGLRGSDALRYQFALATGDRVPEVLSSYARSGSPAVGSTGATAVRSTAEFLTAQSKRPTVIGLRSDAEGRNYAVTASPLLGVTWMRDSSDALRPVPAAVLPDAPAASPAGQSPTPQTGAPATPAGTPMTDARPRDRQVLSGLESSIPGLPGTMDRGSRADTARREPSDLNVARRADTAAPSPRIEALTAIHSKVVHAFRSSLSESTTPGKPTDTTKASAEPDEAARAAEADLTPWQRELQRLREALSSNMRPAGPSRPDRPEARETRDERQADRRSAVQPQGDVQSPTQRELESSNPLLKGLPDSLLKALRDAGVRLDTLGSAPVADNQAYSVHMKAAEEQLTAERFFAAEDRFVRALAAMPADPMARIGRVHAQLGAGLYLSAALNLRTLFADNPELLGVQFAARLAPSPQRAAVIAAQLRKDLAANNDGPALGRDTALLLTYLGHIRSDAELIREGCAEIERRQDQNNPGDSALLDIARKLWLPAAEAAQTAAP